GCGACPNNRVYRRWRRSETLQFFVRRSLFNDGDIQAYPFSPRSPKNGNLRVLGAIGVLQRTHACRGEYHAEDFDGSGCSIGHRHGGGGNVGHGGGAVGWLAWRLAWWMGVGSRPGHRRTCCRRPDRRCFGGAVRLSIPLRLLHRLLRYAAIRRSLRVAAGVERVRLGARQWGAGGAPS